MDHAPRHWTFGRRTARAATHVAIVLAIVSLSAVTFAARTEQAERAEFPPPGHMVDIGDGQRIHVRTWGSRAPRQPAIVLDVSAGMPSSEWAWIGRMLGERHFVVAYDRPGMGWSTGPERPRDAMSAANALDQTLTAAGIAPPYIVIGHSYGGVSARAFAGTHRDSVAGLVLLDTTNPDEGGGRGFALTYRLMAWRAFLGMYALGGRSNDLWELPPDEQAAANAVSKWPSFLDTAARELEAWDVSARQVRSLDLSGIPLLVICSPYSPEHIARQKRLAALSTRSTYLELNVDHMGMLVNRDQARLVADSIEEFLAAL